MSTFVLGRCASSPRLHSAGIVPYPQKDIKLIERMQWLATTCVENFRRQPYPERLHELKLPSMQRHLLRATLNTVYKLFHSCLNLTVEDVLNCQLQVTSWGSKIQGPSATFLLCQAKSGLR